MTLPLHIQAIIFDFDGVLTNDKVYIDQDGREMVCCSRKDGIGFDLLRDTNLKIFIVSTERNPVVTRRGEKLRIPVLQGVCDKAATIRELATKHNFCLSQTLFIGNDINDLPAMRICGYSACPRDSNQLILSEASFVLKTKGGDGVAREIAESILSIDALALWKSKSL